MLRLQVEVALGDGFPETCRSILITSTMQGEGKTTTAVNLARANAVAGIKTLLIDADNRHPMINHVFKIDQTPGLTEAILAGSSEKVSIQRSPIEKLDLISAGARQEFAAELLGSECFEQILTSLKKTYQLIIIDSTPFGMFADSGTIARKVDATFVVFYAGKTEPRNVEKTIKGLKGLAGNVKGVILSRVSAKRHAGYTYGYHDYYASYEKHHRSDSRPES
ncbi:CpsD/CapB family tyrosine-protein kinase [bacterium]|nr:CpsD/CapB family tyrosine-protein kinase [candidate division CSSED10-310 bacterium]